MAIVKKSNNNKKNKLDRKGPKPSNIKQKNPKAKSKPHIQKPTKQNTKQPNTNRVDNNLQRWVNSAENEQIKSLRTLIVSTVNGIFD